MSPLADVRIVFLFYASQPGHPCGTSFFGTEAVDWILLTGTPVGCPEDVNSDGDVNIIDLLLLLSNFGTPGPDGDITGSNPGDLPNGIVNILDLLALLAAWGPACPGR